MVQARHITELIFKILVELILYADFMKKNVHCFCQVECHRPSDILLKLVNEICSVIMIYFKSNRTINSKCYIKYISTSYDHDINPVKSK